MPETKAKKTKKTKKNRVSRSSYLSKDYFIDCSKEGMLYAALVRSPLPSGKITNINFSELPEGYYFFSARDIPGANEIVTMGIATRVFCNENVHFMGQPVGIVCGPDLKTTQRLAKEVQITFDITTIESALQEAARSYNRPVIRLPGQEVSKDSDIADFVDMMNIMPALDELPAEKKTSYTRPEQIEQAVEKISPMAHRTRILAQRTVKTGFFKFTDDEQIIDDEYNEAAHQISDSWTLEEHSPDWTEPSGAFCFKEGSKLTVMTTTQWSSYLLKNLSRVLNMDEEKIIIQKTLSQTENTNGIWRCTTLAVQTALAALLTEKPVKLILTKEEQHAYLHPGMNTTISYRSAVEADGTIKAMRITVDCDAGYSNPFADEAADRLAVAVCGLYNVENLDIQVTIRSSENPPTSIYPEMTDSQAFFALENHIQQIAEQTAMLPDEIRLKNLCLDVKSLKSPYHIKLSKPAEAMSAIIAQSDFNRKYTSFRLNSQQNKNNDGRTFFALPRRGIGMTIAYDGACFYGTRFPLIEEKMEVVFTEDEKLVINAVSPSTTNSAIWKKIAAEILQIEMSNVSINPEYAATEETFMPENFYNDISIMSVLLKRACEEINKKRKTSPLPITAKKTITSAMKNQWKKEKFEGSPFQSAAFGTAIVELELNADTYLEKINGIWIAIDCGELLSLRAAESSVRLAIQQELERLVKDTRVSCEQIRISFLESKNPPCQIGKLIHNLIPAAFTSALSLALSTQVNRLPCTEQLLYDLTQAQKDEEAHDDAQREPQEEEQNKAAQEPDEERAEETAEESPTAKATDPAKAEDSADGATGARVDVSTPSATTPEPQEASE